MKKALLIVISLLFIDQLQAQNIRDTVFNDVISIPYQYVTTDGTDFLIDMPIQEQKEPIVIFYNDRRIPVQLFFDRKSFLSKQNEIILITPNWEYHDEIIETQKREGIHIKAYVGNKIYHIKRNNAAPKVDSLATTMDFSTGKESIIINFKKAEIVEKRKYYYAGALSAADDNMQHREKRNVLDSLNTHFDIYAGSYYSLGYMYYTLFALPLEKKLPAIKAIAETFRFKDNDHLKDFDHSPKIYLPHAINYDSFDFYFESSKFSPTEPLKGWQENDNTATIRLGYWRGDCCGDVPETERVSAKVMNDTVYINYNKKREPNCDSSIGLCGNAIDFVINKKKYPNYKKLTFKTIE